MLPKNVTTFKDRHGKQRYRFRKVGMPTYSFAAQPGTPEFEAELEMCRNGQQPDTGERERRARIKAEMGQRRKERLLQEASGLQVYFIGEGRGLVKIGYTSDLRRRLYRHQCANPKPLTILAVTPGDATLEAEYHARFADAQVRGEWFKITPEIRAEMERLNG